MTGTLVPVFAALADDTRWAVLQELGRSEQSASALATRFPVSRQAIAKHLAVLADAGLVESVRAGREIRYRALGSRLSETARALDSIGAEWDRRLSAIAAEGPSAGTVRKQIVGDVADLRHAGEMKAYIDLLFLALVILLCIAKIVTN